MLLLLLFNFSCDVNDPEKAVRPATINFSLSDSAKVTMYIENTYSSIVKTLYKKQSFPMGFHSIYWDGLNEKGKAIPVGLYFAVIEIETSQGKDKLSKPIVVSP